MQDFSADNQYKQEKLIIEMELLQHLIERIEKQPHEAPCLAGRVTIRLTDKGPREQPSNAECICWVSRASDVLKADLRLRELYGTRIYGEAER